MLEFLHIIEFLEVLLSSYWGNPTEVGASSWLEALSWIAALLIAVSAWISIRRQSLQSRASLLFSIYEHWEAIASQRERFSNFLIDVRHDVQQKESDRNPASQIKTLRSRYKEKLIKLKKEKPGEFGGLVSYLNFFEFIGEYVRRGYLPFREVRSLYKGPVLDIDIVFRDFIAHWQNEAHVPPGLLANAVYLMNEMRLREEQPFHTRWVWRLSKMQLD